MIWLIKKLMLGVNMALIACSFCACENGEVQLTDAKTELIEVVYDSLLANQLGADDYGMTQYVMAFLKKGPNRSEDAEKAAELQKAHLENIRRLADEGKLVLAGPFMDDGEIRGIYVFKVNTIEEAEKLTSTDPAIQAGTLVMELHPWYGTAALPILNEYYPKIAKTSF
jgi:uncharacterized protein YciI